MSFLFVSVLLICDVKTLIVILYFFFRPSPILPRILDVPFLLDLTAVFFVFLPPYNNFGIAPVVITISLFLIFFLYTLFLLHVRRQFFNVRCLLRPFFRHLLLVSKHPARLRFTLKRHSLFPLSFKPRRYK